MRLNLWLLVISVLAVLLVLCWPTISYYWQLYNCAALLYAYAQQGLQLYQAGVDGVLDAVSAQMDGVAA